jgi:NAD(P)-dependent dehydrogenase (short-subunit alcohol dehydrogenase family)
VTGGNGGIGYGMARALLASGASVAIWGSRADKTAKAKEAAKKRKGTLRA